MRIEINGHLLDTSSIDGVFAYEGFLDERYYILFKNGTKEYITKDTYNKIKAVWC